MLGWQLILFWSTLHFITHVISSYRPQRRDSQQGLGTSWSLKWITLHVETNAFNNLPENVLLPFDPRRRSKSLDDGQRPGALLFDLGAITATMCFLAAQVVLVWATSKSMLAMWRVYSGHADPLLARRDLAASDGLVLRPVIPGVTLPMSDLPIMLLALLVAQMLHEAAHAVAAASEGVPLLCTGFYLWLVLPAFYVSFAAQERPSLRINSAGVCKNIVLAGAVWAISQHGLGISNLLSKPFYSFVSNGVAVISTETGSPLQPFLVPSTVVTHLDDVQLNSTADSSVDLWSNYLRAEDVQMPSLSSMGWCMPRSSFSDSLTVSCCSTAKTPIAAPALHDLCFVMDDLEDHHRHTACVDPMGLLPPSKRVPQRCLTSGECPETEGCAVLGQRDRILRIVLAPNSAQKEGRTVVWQGKKHAVLNAVRVTNKLPRFWWVPSGFADAVERFYSHLIALSLAVAFFNLLPLPHLDGTHILSAFLQEISAAPNFAEGLGISVPPIPGPLETFLDQARKVTFLKRLAAHEDLTVRAMTIWTSIVGALLLGSTVAVEWSLFQL